MEDTITAGDQCETAPGVPSPVIYWSPVWWMTNGLVTRLVKMKGWSMKVRELFHLWAHNGRCSWRKNIVSHSLKHPKPYTVHAAVRWPRKGPWCRAQHPGRCPRCSGFGGLGLRFTSRAKELHSCALRFGIQCLGRFRSEFRVLGPAQKGFGIRGFGPATNADNMPTISGL